MAAPGGGMTVLPQFQGDYYSLMQRQALAQAMMQRSLSNQTPAAGAAVGPYQVQAQYSPLAGASQLAQAYMAAKMNNSVSQGMNSLGQQQWQYLVGQNPNGGGTSGPLQQPLSASAGNSNGADGGVSGGANSVPATNVPGTQSVGAPQQPQSAQPGLLTPGSAMNPGGMPVGQAAMAYLHDPDAYQKEFVAPYYQPTDIQRDMRAAGIDPNSALGRQIMQQQIAKQNYIAPTSVRPGGALYNPQTGSLMTMPATAPPGFQAVQDSQGNWSYQPVSGGTAAVTASAAANAQGHAQYKVQRVWDPQANGAQGGYVNQTVANVAQAANGGAPPAGNPALPAPLRNNNPGALMPNGRLAAYPDWQTGFQAMDNNLQAYGKQGIKTLSGVISKWAPPNENNTQAYIQDVTQRLGISPNQQIDLNNPAERFAVGMAIMMHENGAQGVFAPPGSAAPAPGVSGGPMAAEPPLGATNAANAAQTASPQSMQKDYEGMLAGGGGPNGQQSLDALNKMMALSKQKNPLLVGPVGEFAADNGLSVNGGEYEKQRANVINLIGGATDADRANVANSIPDYGKPPSVQAQGIQTRINQIQANLLRRQVLTPAYNSGNSNAYTSLANGFDQNIKPSMMPILGLTGPQQQAAVQAAVKVNPALRSNFEWAYNNGLLK